MRTSVATSALIAGLSMPALAQDEEPTDQDTIVVTGSLIPRADLQATTPVTVVGSEDLTLSNTVNNEEFLNTLPQTIPGFDQTSNNPGLGEATVDLRGLGSARTLVLVNGRRYVSSNQNPGVVDLNTIPASLVDRIEIVTGGASATYGSDAVAGVVNFIMKDDFEGIQLDTSFEFTEELDGEIFDTSLTVGSNFDNGRGNVTFFGSYTNREAVFQGDRPETAVTLVDAGTGFSETGSVNIPSGFVLDFNPDFSAGPDPVDPFGDGCLGEDLGSVDGGGFCTTPGAIDDDFTPGWIFNPNGGGALPHIDFGPNTTRYNYAPVNYLQLPQDRFSIAGFSHYDITDGVEAYFRGIWTQSNVKQALAPTPVFTTLTINADNPFVGSVADPQAWEMIENNDPDPRAAFGPFCGDFDENGVDDCIIVVGRRMLELGPRISDVRNSSFQLAGGFRGNFWDTWGWDLYGAYAAADSTVIQTGNVSISAWQEEVREGRANLFDEGGLSDDVVTAISRTGAIVGRTQQSILNGSFYGDAGENVRSPFADSRVSFAGGIEYRREQLDALPDSVLGPDVAGFNQAPEVHGSFFVWEAFGEVKVPLIENKPFAEELTFEAKYRYSDYSNLDDTVDTYAYGGTWTPISGLKFRGQFQRAVRAPNIGELFTPLVNGFPNVEDPCSSGLGGYDELVADDPGLAAVLQANCTADGVDPGTVGTPFQVNSQIEGLFGGNPDLQEESSDTWTVGVVIQPDAVKDLSLTVDYYNVVVKEAISAIPSQELFDTCYLDGLSTSCDLIDRAGGPVVIFRSNQQNIASLTASGIDVQLDYSIGLADMGMPDWGRFSVYVLGSWVESSAFEVTRNVECVGLYAGACGEPTPEYRVNTRFDWSMGPWLARVRWRWIDAVTDIGCVDGCGLFVKGVDSKSYVDLTTYYQVNEHVLLGFGVQNVFGTELVKIGDASAEQSNTYPATYETLGRHFFFRTQVKF